MISTIPIKLIGNYRNMFLLLLVSFLTTSCYSVSTSSYSDQEFKRKKYNMICVYSYDDNFVHRSLLEQTMIKELRRYSVYAIEGSVVFPPTRERKESEFLSELMKNGVDGFLKFEIVIEEKGVIKTNNSGGNESENISNSVLLNQSIKFKYKVTLIDVKTNKVAWIGSSELLNYYGIDQYNRETFFGKLSESIIEELQAKGHINQN
ncbi:MAG: hypothetical protein CVV25_01490 [Ignavibacteriae bacterium HGW-Ignavibacteriae-4]|nr:MAG: hypothetical protein CVV25_01490 [Ignavibacteriae bacterium HGW-Ignavibacteriae-4]